MSVERDVHDLLDSIPNDEWESFLQGAPKELPFLKLPLEQRFKLRTENLTLTEKDFAKAYELLRVMPPIEIEGVERVWVSEQTIYFPSWKIMDEPAKWLMEFLNDNQLIVGRNKDLPVELDKDAFRLKTDTISRQELQKLGEILFQAAGGNIL